MTWLYRDHPLATSNPAVQTMQHSRSKQISAPSQPHTGHVGWSCDIITQFHVQHTLLYSTDNLTADFSSTIKSVLCFLTQGSRMLKCNSNYWLRQIFFFNMRNIPSLFNPSPILLRDLDIQAGKICLAQGLSSYSRGNSDSYICIWK